MVSPERLCPAEIQGSLFFIDMEVFLKNRISGFECVSGAGSIFRHLGVKPDFVVAFVAVFSYH